MVKFYINGIEIQETPVGWQDYTHAIRLDRELKGVFEVVDVSVTFMFDGYQMLKAAFDANGYCFSYPIVIKMNDGVGNYLDVYTGTLYFKDIEFTEGGEGYGAKCQITDNSFFSKIYNNRNLKAKVYVGKSKSGIDITPVDYWRVTFFNPTTGTYYSHLSGAGYERNDTGFKVYQVLKFLVDFMSDGQVKFISDTFDSGGIGEGAMITCGIVPRFTSGVIGTGLTQELFEENWPDLSFADVLKELDKEYNLGFKAGYDGATPYIRIEEWDYLFPENVLQDFPDVEKLKRKTATELLPAKLLIGSENTEDETFLSFPESIRFLGFNSEDYAIVNNCNTDRELDLVNKWIISSNIIEDLVTQSGAPTTYDSDIILINTILDNANYWGDAVQSDWLGSGKYYYNELYINSNKAARYLGSIPADIAAYLGNVDDTFTAESTAYDPTFPLYYDNGNDPERMIECDNELTDPSNNYDPINFYYEAPNTGVYTFYGLVKFELINFAGGVVLNNTSTVFIRRTDSSGTPISDTPLVSQISSLPAVPNYSAIYSISGTANVVMNSTDRAYLYIKVDGSLVNYRIYPLAQYGCTGTTNGGGVYYTYDPTDYPIMRNTFDYNMSLTKFKELQANPLGLLSFGVHKGKKYFGWIEEIKFKPFQKASNFILISNEKNNQ